MKQLFATTARGFEELLKVELTELGATECKIAQGGVHFQADDEILYRSLLWSRLASRILLPIVMVRYIVDLDLYSIVTGQDWLSCFDEKATFFVDFNGTNQEIRHTQFWCDACERCPLWIILNAKGKHVQMWIKTIQMCEFMFI